MKASNDNHIFINEKLNKCLQKFMRKSSKHKGSLESTPGFGDRRKSNIEEKKLNNDDYE